MQQNYFSPITLKSKDLVLILEMKKSRPGGNVGGSADVSSIEAKLGCMGIRSKLDYVLQAVDLIEGTSEENLGKLIGKHVSKRFAELMYEGVVESRDNASEMFKVVYSNGHSEEMRLEELTKYLVPHEHHVHSYPNELPNKTNETGEGLALIAPAPPTRRHQRTGTMSSGSRRKGAVDGVVQQRQASKRVLSHSTRNNEASRGLQHAIKNNEITEIMELQCSTKNDEKLKMTAHPDSGTGDGTSGAMKHQRSTQKQASKSALSHSTQKQASKSALSRSTRNNETSRGLRRATKNNETTEIMELQHSMRNDEKLKMIARPDTDTDDGTSGMMKLQSSTQRQASKRVVSHSNRNNGTSRGLQRATKNNETTETMELQRSTMNDEKLKMIARRNSDTDYGTSGVMKLQSSTQRQASKRAVSLSARNNETSRGLRRATKKKAITEIMEPPRSTRNDEKLKMSALQDSDTDDGTSGMMERRHSTRKRKQLKYNYSEETTDEDKFEYAEAEPDYPLPPLIQVPWADKEEEPSKVYPMKGLMNPKDPKGHLKRHWVSLRMSAAALPKNGPKIASDVESD